jgi:hypothetical protein
MYFTTKNTGLFYWIESAFNFIHACQSAIPFIFMIFTGRVASVCKIGGGGGYPFYPLDLPLF